MDQINKYGIMLGDIYILNYCGILVFFEVAKTRIDSVFLVELKSEDYLDGTMISKPVQASKDPLVILKNNTYRKSEYEVFPMLNFGQYWLPIKVDYGSKLFKKAERECQDYPPFGIVYAVPIRDAYNKYFKKNIKKMKKIFLTSFN